MCLIIYKNQGVILNKDLYKYAMENNPDGAGYAIVEKDENGKDELNIYKGMFDFEEEFWKNFEPHQDKQAIIHFRIQTHGEIDGQNCHPFRVTDDLVFAHNGMFHSLPRDPNLSDTAIFCNRILKPFAEDCPDFWRLPKMEWFIENSIGKHNKLVLMDVKGNFKIFNESAGIWKDEAWFSNTSYTNRGKSYNHYAYNPPAIPQRKIDPIESPIDDERLPFHDDTPITPVAGGSSVLEIESMFETDELAEIDRRLIEAQQRNAA